MIKLPAFTFLNAPPRSGKSTLAELLEEQDRSLVRVSFGEPLRLALCATFYPDQLGDAQSLDLRSPTVKAKGIPINPRWTNEQFLIDYGTFLKAKTNENVLGDLAKKNIEKLNEYYSRFVFDDARTTGDVAPFINGYGASECLFIHLERNGALWRDGDIRGPLESLPGVRHIRLINNSEPEHMLKQLALLLGGTTDAALPQSATPSIGDL
jgi:hypothetical protein